MSFEMTLDGSRLQECKDKIRNKLDKKKTKTKTEKKEVRNKIKEKEMTEKRKEKEKNHVCSLFIKKT
jgi:hypothetical protein